MFDYDAVIIGGGPAGLAAGIYLARARRQTILLGKQIFDGPLANLEMVENYPGFSAGVTGASLVTEMATQAMNFGMPLEQVEVTGIEPLADGCRVKCADGRMLITRVLIIASGTRHKKLGVPGEELLWGKGVFSCALCDGSKYAGRVVAVCGGGDAGVTEALYMTKLASRVILIELMPSLTACAVLKERAAENPRLEIRCGTRVEAIIGQNQVEGVQIVNPSGQEETLKVDGVLVQIGLVPNTGFLNGIVPLDSQGRIIVNENMETKVPCILAAGDIRSGSPNQIVTAAGDGATAAITAEKILQRLPS